VDGFFSKALVQPSIKAIAAVLDGSTKLQIFNDWFRMTGYDGEARQELTAFQAARSSSLVSHVCLNAGIVSMGVSMANAELGKLISVTSDHEAFYEKLRALTPTATHLQLTAFAAGDDEGFEVQSVEV
jgi:hypothetical protein